MKRSRIARLMATIVAVGALTACAATPTGGDSAKDAAPEITLRYAFFAPASSFPGVQMEEWAKQISERTDGRVAVELFAGGTLLGSGDIFDGVSEGVVDIGLDATSYDMARYPLSSVVSVPIDFPNAEVASKTFLTLLEEYQPAELDGYEIVTAFTSEPAYIQTSTSVSSRADLSGLRLRAPGSAGPLLSALGASTVGMPLPDVAQALQTKVVDGYMASREVLKDFSLAEQVGFVADYPMGVSGAFVAVMDKKAYDALPQDVQDIISDLRGEMSQFAAAYHDDTNVQGALDWATSTHGLKIVPLADGEKAAWDKIADGIVKDWLVENKDQPFDAQKVLDRTLELRDQYSAE